MTHLEILVEEASIEPVIHRVMSTMQGPSDSYAVRVFQGKPDLLKNLPNRLKGYQYWPRETGFAVFIVVDRDSEDCVELKERISAAARDAGLRVKGDDDDWDFCARIVVEELEAWFFGDWEAVVAAFPRVRSNVVTKSAYRYSDSIQGGTAEALQRVLTSAGYRSEAPAKLLVADRVALHMDPSRNESPSFKAFSDGIQAALARGQDV